MQKIKHQKIIRFVFLLTLLTFLCGYLFTYTTYKIQAKKDLLIINDLKMQGYLFDDYEAINYALEYPFSDDVSEVIDLKPSLLNSIKDKFSKLINKLDKFANEHVLGKELFIKLFGQINHVLNLNMVNQEAVVYKMDNKYLTYLEPLIDVSNNATNLNAFYAYCDKMGVPLAYVQAPYKISKYQSALKEALDFSNIKADHLLSLLDPLLPIMDLRENFYADNYSNEQLFYQSDHHWKSETGLLATTYLVAFLENTLKLDVDKSLLQKENFEFKILEDYFLGSQGKKMGLGSIESEDFTIITPKFDTNFTYICESAGIEKTDRFDKVMFNYAQLYKKDLYNLSPYEAYAHGNYAHTSIINHNAQNNTKLLLIRDSYSSVVAPFLALSLQQLDIIDLRYFNGSLENYLEQNMYDGVVVLYNPSAIVEVSGKQTNNFFYFK